MRCGGSWGRHEGRLAGLQWRTQAQPAGGTCPDRHTPWEPSPARDAQGDAELAALLRQVRSAGICTPPCKLLSLPGAGLTSQFCVRVQALLLSPEEAVGPGKRLEGQRGGKTFDKDCVSTAG